MSQPRRYQRMLEQLGRFLAMQEAEHVEIIEEETCLTVCWQSDGALHRRCLNENDLARLQPPAQLRIGRSGSRAALLGALGAEIDRAQMDLSRIYQESDAFLVTGSINGRYLLQRYSFRELSGRGTPSTPIRLPIPGLPRAVPPQAEPITVAAVPLAAPATPRQRGDTEVLPIRRRELAPIMR